MVFYKEDIMKQLSYMLLLTISCSSFAGKSPLNSPLGGSHEDVEGAYQAPRGSFDLTVELPESGKRKRRNSFVLPVRKALTKHAELIAFLNNAQEELTLTPREDRNPDAPPDATLAYTLQSPHAKD